MKQNVFSNHFFESYRLSDEVTHGVRQAKVSKGSSEAENHLDVEGGAPRLLCAELLSPRSSYVEDATPVSHIVTASEDRNFNQVIKLNRGS